MPTSPEFAAAFHALHRGPEPLRLVNAWDPGSALLMQSLGAPAVATSSAAVAWARGYGDGDHLPIETLVPLVAAITRKLKVPLTVDFEGGYSADPAVVGANVAALIDAGAAGINIEDGSAEPELLCRKTEAVRTAAARAGVPLFINARCDVYLRGLVPPEQRVAELLARGRRYVQAGADGLFAAGAREPGEIAAICAGMDGTPVNILAMPGVPAAAELARLGVRRVSAGSGIAESVYARIAALAGDFLRDGDGQPLGREALPYAELNGLMSR
ncbi:isocitrate lyase/phosphoenolpyruvate mutase family protein [Roseateles sp. DAIF2]|uniref:isocitrate lyase/PEP mutase family protein n=1 Tax=Roseateles sp. DAIF2 TaxID=2714952 RepID=UPI0018A2E87F|nr:isocitrate lyase/phosphoenolpyruvate mutase family protein [Roseateles sp. DAIF2]QPF71971.1 isocitrate lyase/phosphoenolpyruvate mutase family protein [Roseateles sp. DAIF2]